MFEKIAKIIAEYKDIDITDISLDSTLDELGIDSLDLVEIKMELEDELEISIDEKGRIGTVGDIVEAIEDI